MDILTIGGVFGAAIVLGAYAANQLDVLGSADWRFPFANMVGSALILASLTTQWNLPAALIEAAWAIVSLVGFVRRVSR